MTKITVESGPLRGRSFAVPPGKRIGVGRGAKCAIRIDDHRVSRVHCVIANVDGKCVLIDQGSRNGTLVNGRRVKRKVLAPADMVRVGGTFMTFLGDGSDPLVGRTIAGYSIKRRLGRGGMGTVYLGHQVALRRPVAVKFLSDELSEDSLFVDQFLREARSAARLSHPNVVQIYDVGKKDRVLFLSMEYMAGGSLQELLDRCGKLPARPALTCIVDACRALVWAEQRGIVHRDIKPDNMLIDGSGTVKIADFGIASDRSRSKTIYEKGRIIGTPHHMAPEQAEGRPVDHRADIYALGSTLYAMLAGKLPYDGETAVEVLLKKIREDPPPLLELAPATPPGVCEIVRHMMSRDVEQRYASSRRLLKDLEAELIALGGPDKSSVAPSGDPVRPARGIADTAARTRGPYRLSRRVVWSTAAAATVLIAAILLLLWGGGSGENEPRTPDGGREPSPAVSSGGAAPANTGSQASPRVAGDEPAGGERGPETPPPPPPPETLPDVARRELREIVDRHARDPSTHHVVQGELEEFEKRHPQERWKKTVADIRWELRNRGAEQLATLRAETLDPLIRAEELAEARRRLDEFLFTHPLNADAVAAAREDMAGAARELFARVSTEVERHLSAGRPGDARANLDELQGKLPPGYDERVQEIEERITETVAGMERAEETLAAAEEAVWRSYSTLDFSQAEGLLGALPANAPGELKLRRDRLERELRLFRSGVERLQGALEARVGKEASPLPLVGEEGSRSVQREVVRVSGAEVTLRAAGRSDETRGLAELADEAILRLASGDRDSSPDPEVIESIGVFLWRTAGATRAWRFLAGDLGGATVDSYRERLAGAIEEGLTQQLESLVSRILTRESDAARKDWPALCGEAAALLERARDVGGSRELRADVANAYLACLLPVVRAELPDGLFRGDVDRSPSRPDRDDPLTVRVTYDFKNEEQLLDFHLIGSGGETAPAFERGRLTVAAPLRLLDGNPFQRRIKITGVAAGFDPDRPNVNIAVWTLPGDEVSTEALSVYSSRSAETTVERDFLLFTMGLYTDVGGSMDGRPYLSTPEGPVILPANALISAERMHYAGRSWRVRPRALWARRPRRELRRAFPYEIAVTTDSRISWTVAGERLPSRSLDVNVRTLPRYGSVTFLGGSTAVHHSALRIEAELNPLWVEDRLQALAVARLTSIDPDYPFVNLTRPVERAVTAALRAPRARSLFFDGFDGSRDPSWEILNDDPTHHSLQRRPGALTITTQEGGFSGSLDNYKNLFLIPNPAPGRDFDIYTRILDFRPSRSFHQAGIICFDDADNYIKANYERASGRRSFVLMWETGGRNSVLRGAREEEVFTHWLRLRKRGNVYSYFTSRDGHVYTLQRETIWGNGDPKRIGLFAKNANADIPEIDASFDFLEIIEIPGLVPTD